MEKRSFNSRSKIKNSRGGFTLIELLVFAAIFTMTMVSFITVLVAITRVQSRQTSAAEVNQQSQFLLEQIQYYVERSSVIELNQDAATSTLKLRMAASSSDPTYIYASSTAIYLKQTDSGTPQALTTSKVNVSSLTFTKRANPPGHDSVSVAFTMAYNTANVTQQFSEALQTAIARVSAATFDSNVIPSSTATYKLGVSGQTWSSVNDVINFSGSSVGVNLGVGNNPTSTFQVGNSAGGGDMFVSGAGNGLILKSPGGTCFKVTITNAGQFATTTSGC